MIVEKIKCCCWVLSCVGLCLLVLKVDTGGTGKRGYGTRLPCKNFTQYSAQRNTLCTCHVCKGGYWVFDRKRCLDNKIIELVLCLDALKLIINYFVLYILFFCVPATSTLETCSLIFYFFFVTGIWFIYFRLTSPTVITLMIHQLDTLQLFDKLFR